MPAPSLLHLRGDAVFRRFDHDGTTIDVTTEAVRLASVQEAAGDVAIARVVSLQWRSLHGGAAIIPCRADGCASTAVLVVAPSGDVRVDRGTGLEPWPAPTSAPAPARRAGRFGPAEPATAARFSTPSALARDPWGRLWLLERGAQRILLLAPDDLRLLDTIRAPADADLIDLAVADAGVLALDGKRQQLFFQPYGGEWQQVKVTGSSLPVDAEPVAAAGLGDTLVALYVFRAPRADGVRALVAYVERTDSGVVAKLVDLPHLASPLPILVVPGGDLLVGELAGPPGSRVHFTRLTLTEKGLLTKASYAARGFDGRAFFLDADDAPTVTTAQGLRKLFLVLDAPNHTVGRIETYALDAQRYGCAWHRVFVEVCLPPGTSITLDARTSDDLYPDPRPARPPAEGGAPTTGADRFPLGSRAIDDDGEGWMPVGTLDLRPAWADVAFPPPAPAGIDTLEGLIKNPPGRYLWLRVSLAGTKRQSPSIAALRLTFPRPSVLDHLPAFWRADPAAAATMDQVLALFEGVLTEIDGRIEALPWLFDPRSCPPDVLEWLGSFIGLTFDPRLDEGKRRVLLREGVQLFRQRGTLPGLIRLCEIVTGFRVDIIEAFRQRRHTATFLGADPAGSAAAILGPTFELGGDALYAGPQSWESALSAAYVRLMVDRAQRRTDHLPVCPPDDPPAPLDTDPLVAFHRRYAHRFTVVVFGAKDDAVAALLNDTVERAKPAHTLHELCWIEAGFRLGVTTYVGFGTRLGDVEGFRPVVLGESPLGGPTTLSTASAGRAMGTFVGAARVGSTTFQ